MVQRRSFDRPTGVQFPVALATLSLAKPSPVGCFDGYQRFMQCGRLSARGCKVDSLWVLGPSDRAVIHVVHRLEGYVWEFINAPQAL